jgi:xanthine dehydrogenase small subunit
MTRPAPPDDGVRFILNGRDVHVHGEAPTRTLLEVLREKFALKGTKEGCAEGDCGVCTVTLAEECGGALRYRAVNACITFLPMVEGKSVETVEHLATANGDLSPCQRAMVDHHGSQCGFCTPGIVMSLNTAYRANMELDRQSIGQLLAGNLCRCTGYGPIIDAALTMGDYPAATARLDHDDEIAQALSKIKRAGPVRVVSNGQTVYSPDRLDDLLTFYAENPDAQILSGATDIGLWVTKQNRKMTTMIWTGRVDELRQLTSDGAVLTIGAGVTYAELLAKSSILPPDLVTLIKRIGGQQVRQAGTIGGNIANGSPIGDMAPALIALGAELVLADHRSSRTLALEEFFKAYGVQDRRAGEIVREIRLPLPTGPSNLRCYKISKRFDQDISTLCGCFNVKLENGICVDARIAFGGMAGIPKRAGSVEDRLIGKTFDGETIASAQLGFTDDFQPISDMRGSAEYRMTVARNLLRKYYLEIAGQLTPNHRLEHRGHLVEPVQ